MSSIERLLELQDHDCRIVVLQREIHDIPARKQEIHTRLDEHKAAVSAAKEIVKAKQAEIKQIELEIGSRHQRISKLREQQLQLKTNKEFKAMDTEIQGVQAEITRLEDRVLQIMEAIDASGGDVGKRETELKAEAALVQTECTSLDQRAAALQGQMDEVRRERDRVAADIDPSMLAPYDRIFQNKKDRAVVPVENGVCGGCHMTLPPYQRHEAKKRNGLVTCGYCGRIIYA